MKNMGIADRNIRLILGVALIAAGIILQITSGRFWWVALPGAVFFATALVRTCPLYIPFRISTNKD